jgi:hypothetical protein
MTLTTSTQRDKGHFGCAEPITASPGSGRTCLIKQGKNRQSHPFSAENLAFGTVAAK